MYGTTLAGATLYANIHRTRGFNRDIDHPIDNPFSPRNATSADMAESKRDLFFASRTFEATPKINIFTPKADTTPACPCE